MSGSCWGAESDPKEFPVKLCCKNEEEVEERAGSANAIAVANSQTPTIFYSLSYAVSYDLYLLHCASPHVVSSQYDIVYCIRWDLKKL